MSCLGKKYNPVPTKEWYRFENQCVYNTQSLGSVLKNKKLAEEISVLNKGNILQYKKNSSNLTKKQVYAQMARGMWTNRTTNWATQSDTYTNPNTKSLKRVNYTEIIVNPVTASGNFITEDGIICPATNLTPDLDATIVIPDGGSLICNITENQCTGQVYKVTQKNNCNPLSASDVPGPTSAALCYNSALPTYYPRVKRTYGTAGDKWPQGAKLIFPA
uniref:Uncharacterized protein n=1 Tax=viral metagenome TaxID=1070528 RepID=A0A6C0H9V5_9ZZZZ